MQCNRQGESGPVPFRSGRIFNVSGLWYFATREGENHGPFATRQEAETAVVDMIRAIKAAEPGSPGGLEKNQS